MPAVQQFAEQKGIPTSVFQRYACRDQSKRRVVATKEEEREEERRSGPRRWWKNGMWRGRLRARHRRREGLRAGRPGDRRTLVPARRRGPK